MNTSTTLYLGDCGEQLGNIESGSIDLILTSPPYDGIRRYSSGCLFDFTRVSTECHRVLRPGGVLVWVVADQVIDGSESGTSFRQALGFIDAGFRLYDTMIFRKKNPMPMKVDPRYTQSFEYMFVFSKGQPRVVNLLEEPCKTAGMLRKRGTQRKGPADALRPFSAAQVGTPRPATKRRSNVWDVAVGGYSFGHPAIYPVVMARDHVLSWTNPGDVVLDPFNGSGTTGVACIETGRRYIGIDRDPSYLAISDGRFRAAVEKLNRAGGPVAPPFLKAA